MERHYYLEENPEELWPPSFSIEDELCFELPLTPSGLDLLQEVRNEGEYEEETKGKGDGLEMEMEMKEGDGDYKEYHEDRNNEEETMGEMEMEMENGTTLSLNGCLESNVNHNVPVVVDAFQVHAHLKEKLYVACQAVSKIRSSIFSANPQEDSAVGANGGQSRETLEIEDSEVETATMDPADAQRARRMQSNRESARRSRRRKEAELAQLETKVAELRLQKAAFMERFTDITQKYEKAAVDNRILQADVKALEALVAMKEAEVIRVTGFRPVLLGSQGIPTTSMSPFDGSPSVMSTDAVVPMQDGLNQSLYPAAADNQSYGPLPHMT
ncbi:hypothetical protein V6N13_077557 [Hibiscus sabdariffa]|uniref:BZIP domain-containing protein n=1 Tax=Hibiscus sabdariffa TaxID=183260 RepID=A0ABR2CP78_9ROSI